MNPKEIAEELIIKMINAADRKQTQRVRGMLRRRRIRRSLEPKRHARRARERGRVRDVVAASARGRRRPTLRLATLSYCLRRRASAPSATRIFYTAPGARTWEIFGRQIFEIFKVSGEYKITSFQFATAVQRGNKNFLKELQARKKRSKLGQIYAKLSGKK